MTPEMRHTIHLSPRNEKAPPVEYQRANSEQNYGPAKALAVLGTKACPEGPGALPVTSTIQPQEGHASP